MMLSSQLLLSRFGVLTLVRYTVLLKTAQIQELLKFIYKVDVMVLCKALKNFPRYSQMLSFTWVKAVF